MLKFFKVIVELIKSAFAGTDPQINTFVSTAVNVVNDIKNAVDNPESVPSFPSDILPFIDDAIVATGLINRGALQSTQSFILSLINMIRNASPQHQNMLYHKVASNIVSGLSKGELSEHQADTIVQLHYATTKPQ